MSQIGKMIVRPASKVPADALPVHMYLCGEQIVVAVPDEAVAPKGAGKRARAPADNADVSAAPADAPAAKPAKRARKPAAADAPSATPDAADATSAAPAAADAAPAKAKRARKAASAAPAVPVALAPAAPSPAVALLLASFKELRAKAVKANETGKGDDGSVAAYAWLCAAHAAGGKNPGADKPPNTFNHPRRAAGGPPVPVLTKDKTALTPEAASAVALLLATS